MPSSRYKRIVLKISGESLCAPGGFGIDGEALETAANELKEVAALGVQIALVVGGGNLLRGKHFMATAAGGSVQKTTADYMGMLATVINALALQDALELRGVPTRVMSAIPMNSVCEPYIRRKAIDHLARGRIVLFAAGTGSPFFTTDMCAALRAGEVDAEVVLKATKVDGVYDRDPMKDPQAVKYDRLTYQKVLQDRLEVMDLTAITMCMTNKIPILVFKLAPGAVLRALCGAAAGTLVAD